MIRRAAVLRYVCDLFCFCTSRTTIFIRLFNFQYYLEHKVAPPLNHFVVPVSPVPVFKQPFDLLPKIWQEYISSNFVVLKR